MKEALPSKAPAHHDAVPAVAMLRTLEDAPSRRRMVRFERFSLDR